MPKLRDLDSCIGKKYGKLTIIRYAGLSNDKWKRRLVTCKCDCGNIVNVHFSDLYNNKVKSCGCRHREIYESGGYNKTHGLSKTRLYRIYEGMKARCTNPHRNCFENYGGRGIDVCEEWKSDFKAFADWAMSNGYSDTLSLERKNVDKGYSPDNCCWIPLNEQSNNKQKTVFITYNDEKKPMSVWAKQLGVSYWTLRYRKDNGWSDTEIIEGKRKMAESEDKE